MAFKSVEEFMEIYKRDPARANKLLSEALSQGKKPISKENSGYSKEALMRRAKGMTQPRKLPRKKRMPRPKPAPPFPGSRYPTTK